MRGLMVVLFLVASMMALYLPAASADVTTVAVESGLSGYQVAVLAPCAKVECQVKTCGPAQCKPDQAKTKPDQAMQKKIAAKPDQAKPDQIKAKPDQAKPDQAKPDQCKEAGHRKGLFRALRCPCACH